VKKAGTSKKITASTGGTAGLVRPRVRELLTRSPAYRSLPPDKRREVARDTVRVAAYLVDPHGLVSQEFKHPLLTSDDLLTAVDFPSFVGNLIDGVFGAIVNATVQQMEAYAELLADVTHSVSEYGRDKISDDKSRTSLAKAFPDLFCLAGTRGRRLKVSAAIDRSGRARLTQFLGLRKPGQLQSLISAVRRRKARDRQRSLAMGINRIVVTDGRIRASRRR
jgi:hypothetical protein